MSGRGGSDQRPHCDTQPPPRREPDGPLAPTAVAAIPAYVDTERYRLKRFHELTGEELHDPEHLIEASWTRAAEGRPAGSRASRDGA